MSANDASATRSRRSPAAPSRTYDAIVVGARVAGASTAMLMARRGLRVLLVDRAPGPGTDTLSTHALMRAGVYQLDRWGVLGRLRAGGTPPIRQTTIHYGDAVQTVAIKPRGGVEALFAPRRTVLDPILVQAAVEAGVEVVYGVTVERLLFADGRVVGIAATAGDGTSWLARATWVVGADGVRSRVAREVAAPVIWQGEAASAFLYGYWAACPVDGYEWFYRPTATAGIIPTDAGEHCVWVGVPAARFLADVRGDLEAGYAKLLAEAAPEAGAALAASRRSGRLHGFAGIPGYLRQASGPGWALVGDAGSFRDPISAHGITDALRDAEFLIHDLAAHLLAGGPAPERLATYDRLRDEAALPLARISDRIAAYDWDLATVEELLRSLSMAMGHELEMLASLDAASAAA